MQDTELCVFEKDTILNKKVFSEGLIDDLNKVVERFNPSDKPLGGTLAHRVRLEESDIIKINPAVLDDVRIELRSTLSNYFPDMELGSIRIYRQTFGEIKPHVDISSDGISNVTCLVYLSNVEGGELHVKVKRTDLTVEPDKKHFNFKITPSKGYCVCFHKNNIHYAEEVFGTKDILLVDIKTSFL